MKSIWDLMWINLRQTIDKIDVSDINDGVIINVNKTEANRVGDFGVDNKKDIFTFTGKIWKPIK